MYKCKKKFFSLLIFLIVGMVFSCGNEKTKMENPNDLLKKEVFEAVLMDVYLVEGNVRSRIRNENIDSLRMLTTTELNKVYAKNNITHEQFLKNYIHYMNDLKLSVEIMKNISNELIELETKEEIKQKDSLLTEVKIK